MTKSLKNGLLKSSLPLEYEAAAILGKLRFGVTPDFMYRRSGSESGKDSSVDLHASTYLPFDDPNEIDASLDLLVECKYRHPNITWLLLPDPNTDDRAAAHSPVVKGVDIFSAYRLAEKPLWAFSARLADGWKAVEVDANSGDAHDAELRRGLYQLMFATPALLARNIEHAFGCHPDDNTPFFFVPILLTTATLRILPRNTTVSSVLSTSDILSLGRSVPYARLFVPTGPDLVEHCRAEAVQLDSLRENERFSQLDRRARAQKHGTLHCPSVGLSMLLEGDVRIAVSNPVQEVVVCTLVAFRRLLRRLMLTVAESCGERKPLSEAEATDGASV